MATDCLNNNEHPQAGATGTTLPDLASTFGAWLLALKPEVFTHPGLAPGASTLPRGVDALAENQVLAEATPAGVLCVDGTGLLAIVFPTAETAKQLLASNPNLATTLVTCLGDEHAIWLRPSNRLPRNTMFDKVKVITAGIIPVYHPDPRMRCSIYQRGIPLGVDLATLIFTGRLREFFIDWTVRELHGPPIVQVSPRRKALNPSYWGVWISKTVGIQFDTPRGVFVARAPGTNEEIIVEAGQVPGVIASMLQHARQAGADVPAHEINPRRIKEIVAALKMFCSISRPEESEVLAEFVTTKLERRPGSILTKNAATAALLNFRRSRGLQDPANENVLRHQLKLAIRDLLGIGERHDAGRGFGGLALASTNGEQAAQQPLLGAETMLGGKTKPQHAEATAEPAQGA